MAANKKAKRAGAGAISAGVAAKNNEYLQRLVTDADLRDDLRTAFESSRRAINRANGKGPAKALDDKKVQKDLKDAASSFQSAASSLRAGPKRRKRRGIGSILGLAIVGGIAAVALSEDLRKKVLDALFGAEEEFEYSSTTTPSPAPSEPVTSLGAVSTPGFRRGAIRAPLRFSGYSSACSWSRARGATTALELPHWEPGAAGVLCVAGPHAVPVSTATRMGPARLVFALGARREALARLRSDPTAAFCLLTEGLAFTAHGSARVLRERLESAPVVAVELQVQRVQDHLADGRTEMLSAPGWRWLDEHAAVSDPQIRAELMRL